MTMNRDIKGRCLQIFLFTAIVPVTQAKVKYLWMVLNCSEHYSSEMNGSFYDENIFCGYIIFGVTKYIEEILASVLQVAI